MKSRFIAWCFIKTTKESLLLLAKLLYKSKGRVKGLYYIVYIRPQNFKTPHFTPIRILIDTYKITPIKHLKPLILPLQNKKLGRPCLLAFSLL